MRRRTVLAGIGASLGAPAVRAQARSGVALVIGNSKYQWEAPLPNVRRDAPDIARSFQGLGLQTDLVQDAGRAAMLRAVEKFSAAARGANLAAFYFAGHGAQWGRDIYLVPVDADIATPDAVKGLVHLPLIHDGLSAAARRLLALDNCRNNPADGWRQRDAQSLAGRTDSDTGAGLPPDTLHLFSTAPGRVALDGPAGENSPFAATLMHQLNAPSVDLRALPMKLRRELLIATEGRQVLFDRNSYQQPFVLSSTGKQTAPAARSAWSGDPARIVELSGAYAFAQQSGLLLPPGLLAYRTAAGSRDSRKIGAFKFLGWTKEPSILVVMSVEEQRSAEIILATRGLGGKTVGWRFLRGTVAGDTLDIVSRDGGLRLNFVWRDGNSGRLTMSRMGNESETSSQAFARLDG